MLSPANRNIFFGNANMEFKAAYSKFMESAWAMDVAQAISMKSETEYFGWTGVLKRARLWLGARVVDEQGARTYALTAQAYEKTVGVDMFELNDDQYGFFADMSKQAAELLVKEKDYQLRDLWFNQGAQTGAYQTGVDGVNGWSASHPVNYWDSSMGTYTNDYRGATGVTSNGITSVGGPLTPPGYATLRQDFMMRKSESGEALGVVPDSMWWGPGLDITAKTILEAEFFSPTSFAGITSAVGNVQNRLRGSAVGKMCADFPAGSLDWFMFAMNHGIKPFTIGLRKGPELVILTSPSDPQVVSAHQGLVAAHDRYVVGWGHPWLSAISGPTVGA